MKRLFCNFILIIFIPTICHAAITPEQVLKLCRLSNLQESPDGEKVAFEVSEPPKGADRNTDIWVYSVPKNDLRQFTTDPKSDTSPRWSPDGKSLAFLSSRSDTTQIYVMQMDGGEARQITSGKNEVSAFEWSPDGKQIAFLATDPPSEVEEKKKTDKDDAVVVDRDDKPIRLWVLDLDSKKVRPITSGTWSVSEFQWNTGDRVIASATDQLASIRWTDKIYSIKISDGSVTLLSAPKGTFGFLSVSKDGQTLSYIADPTDGPNPHDLFVESLTSGAIAKNLTSQSLDRPIADYAWLQDGTLIALAGSGFANSLYKVNTEGKVEEFQALKDIRADFAPLKNGIAFICGNGSEPDEFCVANSSGSPVKVSHFNQELQQLPLVKLGIFQYKSFDGTQIEAGLLKPSGTKSGKLPLIVLAHGGPTGRWSDSFEAWGQLLASHGFAVFYPNIRGSIGYGYRFIEVNRGDWGGGDFKDVMAGVDDLIQRGIADPDQLGIGGWSYGGYMSAWAITQTNRFKAAVAGACMSDLASEFGTEDRSTNYYDAWFNGTPYENQDRYLKSSPMTFVRNARTPTLILQGEADVIDPIGQSQQLYRGLRYQGVETELVLYPREGHAIREEKHRLDLLTRFVSWFDKHLS